MVPMAEREVAVAATNVSLSKSCSFCQPKSFSVACGLTLKKVLALFALTLLTVYFSNSSLAAVLPEERIDITYHSYEGGGTEISGPAFLVRKNFAGKVSAWARYYEDAVSGASIDVEATASPFEETRTEYSLGADYLYNKTIAGISYTSSDSADYVSDRISLSATHDFFGDLTTLSMSFSLSDDQVLSAADDRFEETVETQSYSLALSQILSKSLIVGLTAQTIASEGYLNSPYRSVRFADSTPLGYSYEPELYPETRNSDAIAIRANYYLPYRASLRGEYRYYTDNWGIEANNVRLDYLHPFDHFTLHVNVRNYDQTSADFYSDLFEFSEATNFRARDKELSTFTALSYGVGIEYELPKTWTVFGDKTTMTLRWDQVNYDYDNFSDVTALSNDGLALPAGEEPDYSFTADVLRLSFSLFY